MTDYRALDVWKLAHTVTVSIYRTTAAYPSDERFGLVAQTRRAATSIPSNIAEGAGRFSDRDNRRFLAIATGSVNESEYQLLLVKELGYLDATTWADLGSDLSRVRSMLIRLRQRLADDRCPHSSSFYSGDGRRAMVVGRQSSGDASRLSAPPDSRRPRRVPSSS